MNRADRQLLEVVEIWPRLSTWQKYRLLILALWWAKVVHPTRIFLDQIGLRGKISPDWVRRLTITTGVICIFGSIGLWVSNGLVYSVFVLYLALSCAALAVFGQS